MAPALKNFKIILDNPTAVFEAGEIISGKVIVELNKEVTIRALKLKFRGNARVEWGESEGTGKEKRRISYTGEEKYLETDIYLLKSSDRRITIEEGYHVYPFNFPLPREIPQSFEHNYGNVRYNIKAILDRPWKFDHETTLIFTVGASMNLNELPNTELGIDDEGEVSFCGLIPCSNKGLMEFRIQLPTTGYAVGEIITATVGIDNKSPSVNVTQVKLELEENIGFHARFPHGKTKEDKKVVRKSKKHGPFPKKGEIKIGLQVPPLVCSSPPFCKLITVDHRVSVEISVSGWHCSTTKVYKVIIGNKPSVIMANPGANIYIPESHGTSNIMLPSAPMDPSYQNKNEFQPPYPMPVPPQNSKELSESTPGMNFPFSGTSFTPYPPVSSPYGQPYPPDGGNQGPSGIGFMLPTPSASAGVPEPPPPSYEDIMSTDAKK